MNNHATAAALGDVDYLKTYAEIVGYALASLALAIEEHQPVLDELAEAAHRGADLNRTTHLYTLWLMEDALADFEMSAPVAAYIRRVLNDDIPSPTERNCLIDNIWKSARAVPDDSAKQFAAWTAAHVMEWHLNEAVSRAASALWLAHVQSSVQVFDEVWGRLAAKFRELLAQAPTKRSA